ncbi:hypothetical protein B0A49_10232 [Cryomyces minteri]|uniref:Protein kinase domain-containing protein n=1 Tax=Cryomyces minteri TaxID=331657 RepID=A0A4V5ND47_9PEZI|nr:hypothetical protein B0A49_10232 [Cryomyces minteri]
MHGFVSMETIRQSMSRSPSKLSKFKVRTASSPVGSPGSPLSPSFSRSFSANAAADPRFMRPYAGASLTEQLPASAKSNKFSLRRAMPLRASSRRTSPNAPLRRALSDTISQGNTLPPPPSFPRASGEENFKHGSVTGKQETDITAQVTRFELDDEPIKFEILKAKAEDSSAGTKCHLPAKSSPLKRSDGIMNLDQASLGSPRAKRRSLHSVNFGSDFNVFDQGILSNKDPHASSMSSTFLRRTSPQRRTIPQRRSKLQQRFGSGFSRPRLTTDSGNESPGNSPASVRTRPRMSLDSAPMTSLREPDSPFLRPAPSDFLNILPHRTAPKPHPLSKALTPSSSTSSMADDSPTHDPPIPVAPARPSMIFSASLPIGAGRPATKGIAAGDVSSADSVATPDAYKTAKPLPAAFMSTGLISKRNRNIDQPSGFFASVNMPDTPSKKFNIQPMTFSPTPAKLAASRGFNASYARHEFGTPTKPLNLHPSNVSPESFGKGVNIFGSQTTLPRRGSFASLESEDHATLPAGQVDSQSSNDELPPTPTKQSTGTGRPHSKGNSLRSSIFGRRTSLGPDTFASPTAVDTAPQHPSCKHFSEENFPGDRLVIDDTLTPLITFSSFDDSSFSRSRMLRQSHARPSPTPLSRHALKSFLNVSDASSSTKTDRLAATPPAKPHAQLQTSPHTPHGLPSADTRTGLLPATPTGPRDPAPGFPRTAIPTTDNDIDLEILARFSVVTVYGVGEFSIVYRVQQPRITSGQNRDVWAVKKTKKPFTGSIDKKRKRREVQVLKALRGHEHIIDVVDTWESGNHLYIQTEFCENGNLKDFLEQAGYKARLDDFRIWKILLEMSQGIKFIHDSGFIHLDLKPANVFIDWEGVLKIGDFGMASSWPAPSDIDGEGDREYIGPEILSGRFDKPADIFALGMIMLEIASNCVLPDNGSSWQKLRAGDLSDLPSLTFSSDSDLVRDESGDPVDLLRNMRAHDLVQPPNFMVDSRDTEALDNVVQWMISPLPESRPVINEILNCGGVLWVGRRRRAGATVFEGNWGPADDVLADQDVDMMDVLV